MKKNLLFLACFILQTFIAPLCVAQNQHKIDSLTIALKTTKEDSNKVDIYLSLGELVMNNNMQEFLSCGKQALSLSNKLNYNKGKIRSLHAIAGYYYFASNYDS